MTKIFRLVGAAAFALLAVFALAGPASAQDYTGGVCTVVVTGNTINIDCEGFPPGTEVVITLNGEVLGTGVVRADGTIDANVALPTECGTYDLTISAGGVSRTSQLNVPCAPSAVTPAGTLPYTGSDSAPIAQIGVALLAAGALVTFVVRQRGKAQA